jgi:hypothetical protein
MGIVMPGSRLENIMLLANKEISVLHWDDFVIIWGGANYVNKYESNIGLKHIRKFALHNQKTNLITLTALHRQLTSISCINKKYNFITESYKK